MSAHTSADNSSQEEQVMEVLDRGSLLKPKVADGREGMGKSKDPTSRAAISIFKDLLFYDAEQKVEGISHDIGLVHNVLGDRNYGFTAVILALLAVFDFNFFQDQRSIHA